MYFPSKKDFWMNLIIWGTIVLCTVTPIIEKEWVATLILIPIGLGMAWLWFSTGYKVEEGQLIIQYGPFKKRVSIVEITKIRRTKNPLSAPALSIDRLEVTYGSFDFVLISPKNQSEFIHLLKKLNPNIRVDK